MGNAAYDQYDAIIVGSGPAGIFAALELAQNTHLRILLLEKGRDLERRHCPIIGKEATCPPCQPCGLVSGWGGAGAFSDGKLTLSPEVGGRLKEYVGAEKSSELIRYVDDIYLQFGASDRVYGLDDRVEDIRRRASLADLRLIPVPIRHVGTEKSRAVLHNIRSVLRQRVEIRTRTPVAAITVKDGAVAGVETADGQKLRCRYLVLAPGREGADWLT